MTKEVEIEALAPVNKHPRGDMCNVGEVFEVSTGRAEQLEASGLARRIEAASETPALPIEAPSTKEAPVPDNKMAPAPENKTARGSVRRPPPAGPAA